MDTNIITLTNKSNESPSLSEDFNSYLVIQEKGFNPNMPCNLHFFEWSDLTQEKLFDDHDKFIKWLSSCKIYSKWDEDKKIKLFAHTKSGAWIICRKGTTALVIENSFDDMKKTFESSVTTRPPYTPQVPQRSPVYAGNYPNCHGYWDEYYEEY